MADAGENKFMRGLKVIKVALGDLNQTDPQIYNLNPAWTTTFNIGQNSVSALVQYTNAIPDDGIMSGSSVVWYTHSNGTADTSGKDDGLSALKITPATTSAINVSISQHLIEVD